MMHRGYLIVALAVSSMLTSAEHSTELPAAAAASLGAMDAAMARITDQRRNQLTAVRNAALIELDAMLTTIISSGDARGAAAVWRSMQTIIAEIVHDARRDMAAASMDPSIAPAIMGVWMVIADTGNAPGHIVEVHEGGACIVRPIAACMGQRRIIFDRFAFNRFQHVP